jgi:signal transduction histidine kinase
MSTALLEQESGEKRLGRALEYLGSALRCSRVLLVQARDNGKATELSTVAKWNSEEYCLTMVHDTRLAAPTLEAFGLHRWRDILSMGRPVITTTEECNDAEAQYMHSRSVRSFVLEPISCRGSFWGYLELDDCEDVRTWDENALATITTGATLLSFALANDSLRDELERNHAELYEAQLNSAVKSGELEEIKRWKNNVFSSFAHEFRTPLYTLLGFSATLIENEELDDDDEIRRMCLQHIYEQARRLENLVKEVLYVSDLQRPNDPTTWEVIDVAQLTACIGEEYREKAEAQGVSLFVDTLDQDFGITCSPEQIRRLISNLIEFGISSTAGPGWIQLRVSADEHAIFLAVSDNGKGVPGEHLARIFEPFYETGQTPATASTPRLGLSIAKDIVDLHHGFITVESREGEGTMFHVTLPRLPLVP